MNHSILFNILLTWSECRCGWRWRRRQQQKGDGMLPLLRIRHSVLHIALYDFYRVFGVCDWKMSSITVFRWSYVCQMVYIYIYWRVWIDVIIIIIKHINVGGGGGGSRSQQVDDARPQKCHTDVDRCRIACATVTIFTDQMAFDVLAVMEWLADGLPPLTNRKIHLSLSLLLVADWH